MSSENEDKANKENKENKNEKQPRKKIVINRQVKRRWKKIHISRSLTAKCLAVLAFLAVSSFFLFYPLDLIENLSHFRYNFRVANYHASGKVLVLLDWMSLFANKPSDLSYKVRYSLLRQYRKINMESEKNLYNSIGLFSSLHKDFEVLYSLSGEDKEGLDTVIDDDYLKYIEYKDKYMSELRDILIEYGYRSKKIKNFLSKGDSDKHELTYQIPDRMSFFLDLADAYLKYERLPVNAVSMRKLASIMDAYDALYKQEKSSSSSSSSSYGDYGGGSYQSQGSMDSSSGSSEYYGKFLYTYAAAMVKMDSVFFMKDNCENSNVINQYLKSLTIQNIQMDDEQKKILEMCNSRD